MIKNKNYLISALATVTLLFGVYGCSTTTTSETAKQAAASTAGKSIPLADKLIFEQGGFRLSQKTQEGTTTKARLTQDATQMACSKSGAAKVDSGTAASVTAMARESMKKPAGGVKLGDWKKGEVVARSGYGFRVGHKTDDHSKREAGGNCYACHQLDPDEIAYGTLVPSLTSYGKIRGSGDEIVHFAYEMIYNPHVFFPCTHMPRFGHNDVLTEQQISDVMAYLFDPASPVNQ